MFEKEAEEYYYENYLVTLNIGEEERKKKVTDIFIKGAEFGFQKGMKTKINTTTISDCPIKDEWHYVKDGDLPNTEFGRADVTVAYINAYENPCKMDCCFDGTNFVYWDDRKPIGWKKVDIFGKIYAWKYQEKLPEIPKENE